MKAIPFTQYMLPDGRPREIKIERSDAVADKAQQIIDAGYRFEAEVLTTGDVSFTVTGPMPDDKEEEGDVDIEVTSNGPGVFEAVDRLVERFHPKAREG